MRQIPTGLIQNALDILESFDRLLVQPGRNRALELIAP